MTVYLRQVAAIVRKDLLLEVRTGERLAAMGALTVLVAVLFHFAIDQGLVRMQLLAAGLIWMTILFGGMLGMGRTFEMEREQGAIQGLLTSPVPLDGIYLAKVVTNFVLVTLIEVVALAAYWLFFGFNYGSDPLLLAGVLGVATLGFVAVTTLFSAISAQTNMGQTLLPILIFPLLVPVVIFGVTATGRIFASRPAQEVEGSLYLLAAFTVVALTAGTILFRYVVEE
ncbi:MAG: heme exporter protein CcmB [Gammaproteobacteria bacterium]|nr:heme exporter protein CcmB [Gammaproteobacteria bacterium]